MCPETLGVWQIEGDSSLNLAASSVLGSSTGHCSPENLEAEVCVFALTGCFSMTETSFGISEASGVRTSLYYKLLPKYMYIQLYVSNPFTSPPPITTHVEPHPM